MPASKINISTQTNIEFKDIELEELLREFEIDQKLNNSGIQVSTNTTLNINEVKFKELRTLIQEKKFSNEFGNLNVKSETIFSTTVDNLRLLIDDFFENNKLDYVKRIELISIDKSEIVFKIHTKIGLSINLVIELPITLERFLIVNFKIKNGVKIFLKLINSILKFSSNKSIIGNDNNVRLDIRELVKIPEPILHIIDHWISNLKGEIVFEEDLIKLNTLFRIDKKPFEELNL